MPILSRWKWCSKTGKTHYYCTNVG